MKTLLPLFLLLSLAACSSFFGNREAALEEAQQILQEALGSSSLQSDSLRALFVAYKDEDLLEVYLKNKAEEQFRLFRSYAICARSGKLGPKRAEGDRQVPEGLYFINRFNPKSSFFLSLGLNYPNKADSMGTDAQNPGSDIFIHGACVTVGCLPMTDAKMAEIYQLALWAKAAGQSQIPVYIFPFRMEQENMANYSSGRSQDTKAHWAMLAPLYRAFATEQKALRYRIGEDGRYELLAR